MTRSLKVGLVRHFPVREPMPVGWLTAAQLHAWRIRYDAAAVIAMDAPLPAQGWIRAFSSDLPRAMDTAKALFAGPCEATSLLREPDLGLFPTGRLSLPPWAWRWILRFVWITGHRSQRSVRDDFVRRVGAVADLVEAAEGDALLFSHAGMMAYLRKELLRRGFNGPGFRVAEPGKLYVFERADALPKAGATLRSKRTRIEP